MDVHRLTVAEALSQMRRALRDALDNGASELRIITGRGNHSQNKVSVLKPAIITELIKYVVEVLTLQCTHPPRPPRYRVKAEPDPKNDGVLVIRLPTTSSTAKT